MPLLLELDSEGDVARIHPVAQDHLLLGEPEAALLGRQGLAYVLTARAGGLVSVAGRVLGERAAATLGGGERIDVGGTRYIFVADPAPDETCGLPPGGVVLAGLDRLTAPALLLAEVDGLEAVLLAGGPELAGRALRAAADALRAALPPGSLIGRDGPRFTIAVDRAPTRARQLVGRLVDTVRAARVEPEGVTLALSVGLATAPPTEPTAPALQRAAEAALATAKAAGGGRGTAASSGARDPTALERGFAFSPAGRGLLGMVEQLLETTDELEPFLELLLALVVERTGAERGLIFLAGADGSLSLARRRAPGDAGLGAALTVSRSLVHEAARERRSILVEDALATPIYRDRESVVRARIRSALVVPLLRGRRTVGVLYLDTGSVVHRFGAADRDLLEAFARLVAGPLEGTIERAHLALLAPRDGRSRRPAAGCERLAGESEALLGVLERVERFAASDAPLSVHGESGTGKELFARAIHACSPRRTGPFVAESCAAIPDALAEDALFGHEAGAFSGAVSGRPGVFERAHEGTLLLDGIDEASPRLQAELLRVLETGEVRRLGGSRPRTVSVRVASSSRLSLPELVAGGALREDLAYRLNVLAVRMPPLAERREDVPLLVRHFVALHARPGRAHLEVSASALRLLEAHPWPGNVRQLENEIKRLVAIHDGDKAVEPKDFSAELLSQSGPLAGDALPPGGTLADAVEALERKLIVAALRAARGNRSRAARALGLQRSSLHLKMRRHGIR